MSEMLLLMKYSPFFHNMLYGGFAVFFAYFIVAVVLPNSGIFFKRYAQRHRLSGLLNLLVLLVGYLDFTFGFFQPLSLSSTPFPPDTLETSTPASTLSSPLSSLFIYHVILGLFGISSTLTAAYDFQSHKKSKSIASGSLDPDSLISYNEMIEHSFYQLLLLLQIIFFHLNPLFSLSGRISLVLLSTSPWYFRDLFPINKFSDNYTKEIPYATPLTKLLYRLKKYQYILYKHFLLHGLNVTVALTGSSLPHYNYFNLYWLAINSSYLLEFFMQTLMKKGYISFPHLIALQRALMLLSTAATLPVLMYHVNAILSGISLLLNFIHRKHEITNILIVLSLGLFYHYNY